MKNTHSHSILKLDLSNIIILKNADLKNLKGGAQPTEHYLRVDQVKCENALKKEARNNGDGLW